MDLRSAIHARFGKAGAVARNLVPGRQRERSYRQGKLFPPHGRSVDARQEESDAAGFEIFPTNAEVTRRQNAVKIIRFVAAQRRCCLAARAPEGGSRLGFAPPPSRLGGWPGRRWGQRAEH